MAQSSSLGMLALLPMELRAQIWDYLSLRPGRFEAESPQLKLAFLQASRQVYREASAMVYRDVVLQFHIDPKYQYKSWLTVEGNFGARWSLQTPEDAMKRGYNNLPYEKLRKIQINIEAPYRRDPGQVVCLHKKCVDLVALLECAKHGLPDLELSFLKSLSADWSLEGKPQKSVAIDRVKRYPPKDMIIDRNNATEITADDAEIVLMAFSRLRNARSTKACVPIDMHRDDYLFYNIAETITEKEPVGTYLNPDDLHNDRELQEDLDEISIDLDIELDMLPGPTANMMRLDRFSSWYADSLGGESKYEREYERIMKTWRNSFLKPIRMRTLQWRYGFMRACNPRSLANRYTVSQLSAIMTSLSVSHNVTSMKEAIDLDLISDEWDQDAWHSGYYRLGILPFNCNYFFENLFKDMDIGVTQQYEREFAKKLRAWVVDYDLNLYDIDI
ncbi:MAG: hypothetical protein Q9163_004962 [Psora crenata]